jgi:hypothetical protein
VSEGKPVPTAIYNGHTVPAHTVAALTAAHQGKPLAALNGDAEPILSRLESGESAYEIAQSLNVSDTALYAWLLRNCPEQWQAISAARQLSRIDISEREIDSSIDNVGVSRARERDYLRSGSAASTSRCSKHRDKRRM